MVRLLGAYLTAVLIVATIAPAVAGAGVNRFFLLPGKNNASCELASAAQGLGTVAYCQSGPPKPTSVTMTATGHLEVCHGISCLGNPPDTAPTLAYGKSTRVGPFLCSSRKDGVRCVVRSGHGFLLGASRLTRID